MAKTTSPKTIVLVDDEWHNISWLQEYLESRGFEVLAAETLNEALPLIESAIHRAVIIDLNIPALSPLISVLVELGGAYPSYPGLYLAYRARNLGYRDRQVVLYTVHREAAVTQEANRLGATYILKGRPQEIKREIDAVIAFDPTAPSST